MPRLVCDRCRHPLTRPLVRTPLPPFVPMSDVPGERRRPARVVCGAYARSLVPVEFSCDPLGLVAHPADATGTARHPDSMRFYGCCGPSGGHGRNQVCAACGAEVGTLQGDCYTQNQVVFDVAAVVVSYCED